MVLTWEFQWSPLIQLERDLTIVEPLDLNIQAHQSSVLAIGNSTLPPMITSGLLLEAVPVVQTVNAHQALAESASTQDMLTYFRRLAAPYLVIGQLIKSAVLHHNGELLSTAKLIGAFMLVLV